MLVLRMFELCCDYRNFAEAKTKLLDFQKTLITVSHHQKKDRRYDTFRVEKHGCCLKRKHTCGSAQVIRLRPGPAAPPDSDGLLCLEKSGFWAVVKFYSGSDFKLYLTKVQVK